MKLQNLHTHSEFCDGRNTMEEMVESAIEKGFSSLGFSSHSYMSFSTGKSLRPEMKPAYLEKIAFLKEKYKGIIDVYAGLEFEMLSEDDFKGYEYTIGSCHYFELDGQKINFDCSAKDVKNLVDTYFEGDGMKMVKEYYRLITKLPEYHNFDIVGHFDIITKNNEKVFLFDENSKEYMDIAKEALVALCEKIKIFEINTGPISRGYRTRAYPAKELLREIKLHGGHITVSSDCHNKEHLDANFTDAFKMAKECGFDEIMIFNGKEFVPEKIMTY